MCYLFVNGGWLLSSRGGNWEYCVDSVDEFLSDGLPANGLPSKILIASKDGEEREVIYTENITAEGLIGGKIHLTEGYWNRGVLLIGCSDFAVFRLCAFAGSTVGGVTLDDGNRLRSGVLGFQEV